MFCWHRLRARAAAALRQQLPRGWGLTRARRRAASGRCRLEQCSCVPLNYLENFSGQELNRKPG